MTNRHARSNASSVAAEADRLVQQVLDRISIDRIRADIDTLCAEPRNSLTNPEFHARSAAYIAAELTAAGCSVGNQDFTFASGDTERTGTNIAGTLAPHGVAVAPSSTQSPDILLGAHYDTVPGSPGADDNASGVAVMLECARVLQPSSIRRTVGFVSFDAEERQPEVGLHGSTAYAQMLAVNGKAPSISGAYVLEMIGYSAPIGGQRVPPGLQLLFPRAFDTLANRDFVGDSLVAISNHRSRALSRNLEMASRRLGSAVPILPVDAPRWLPIPHNLKRSDHAPFWDVGVPAIMIGDTANFRNPNYHGESDTPGTLDYVFLENTARLIIAAVTLDAVTMPKARAPRVKLR